MPRELKVYGASGSRPEADRTDNGGRQTREIVAAKSVAEAHRLFAAHGLRTPRSEICETGNETEVALAKTAPGTVFWIELNRALGGRDASFWRKAALTNAEALTPPKRALKSPSSEPVKHVPKKCSYCKDDLGHYYEFVLKKDIHGTCVTKQKLEEAQKALEPLWRQFGHLDLTNPDTEGYYDGCKVSALFTFAELRAAFKAMEKPDAR